MNKDNLMNELNELYNFVEYFITFYAKDGIHPIKNLNSVNQVFKAIDIYKSANYDFQGDSMDREYIRYIIITGTIQKNSFL